MSFYRHHTENLPLPNGYGTTNTVKQPPSNYQYFLSQSPSKEPIIQTPEVKDQSQDQHRARIFEAQKHTPIRRALSNSRPLSAKRYKIFENEGPQNFEVHKSRNADLTRTVDIRDQLLVQLEFSKAKAAVYSGPFQKLLKDLIRTIEQNKERSLNLNHEYNDILFQIRNLEGLDISDKVQIEKIVNMANSQEEKLKFTATVKQELPGEWPYWVEPLYFEMQKQSVPESHWRSFIQERKQSSIN